MRTFATRLTARSPSDGESTAASDGCGSGEEERVITIQSVSDSRGTPLASVGSALHGTGACRPCAWVWKENGCQRGEGCLHCHLCPFGELKARKKAKIKRRTLELTQAVPAKPPRATVAAPAPSLTLPAAPPSGVGAAGPHPAAVPMPQSVSEVGPAPLLLPNSPLAPISLGSLQHGTGECKPCAWFWKPQGCQNGQMCLHCHSCPEGELSNRKQQKSLRLRQHQGNGEPEQRPVPAAATAPVETRANTESQAHALSGRQWLQSGRDSGEPLGLPLSILPTSYGDSFATSLQPDCEWWYDSDEGETFTEGLGMGMGMGMTSEAAVPIAPVEESVSTAPSPPIEQVELVVALTKAAPGLPSIGSELHSTGACRPCAFFWKPQGCQNGERCYHCHLCPEGEHKARRRAKVAALQRQGPEFSTSTAAAAAPDVSWANLCLQ